MLFWLKRTLPRQICFLLVSSLLAWTVSYFWNYQPRLRLSWLNFARGAVAGVSLGIAVLLAHLLAGRAIRVVKRSAPVPSGLLLEQSPFVFTGSCVAAGTAEELLLTGLVFGGALNISISVAFAAVLAGALFLNLRGKRQLRWSIFQTLLSGVYALLYYRYASLLLTATAHFTTELIGGILIIWAHRFPAIQSLLSRDKTPLKA